MRLIDVPLTKLCSFVLIEPEMHAQRNFAVLENVREVEIRGRVVRQIATENDEQVDFARADISDELFDGFSLIGRVRVDWVGIENSLADVAASTINVVGQGVNSGRLVLTDD